ncbi:MAG: SGNH/GDSL hydrolase family protein [Raineya sp.]
MFSACKPNLDPVQVGTKSEIDLSKYVAVGNSLTAGYADGGLYNDAIKNSYPNFLAEQFKLVGGGEFNQPYFDDAQKNGSGYLAISGWSTAGTPNITPVTTELAIVSPSPLRYARFSGTANNNLGIPGIRAVDVTVPAYAQLNPFFERLLPPLTTKAYTKFVEEANPTFFTCWIGNNDVLGYAIAGGDPTGIDISAGFPVNAAGQPNTITATPLFNTSIDSLINALTKNGAKGAVATIPDVATIPFVRTVNSVVAQSAGGFPRITFPLTNGINAAQANLFYIASGYSDPGFTTGSNNFFVISIDNPNTPIKEVRQMNPATDFFLLSAQGLLTDPTTGLAAGLGVLKPNPAFNPLNPIGPGNLPALPNEIPDRAVLDAQEVADVRNATNAFNAKIRSAAQIKGLAVVDANAIFNQIITNGSIDGVSVNSAFVSGGLFSLDGVHLTPKGYAIVANQFIKAINTQYQVKIPLIDINARNIRGILFP